MQTVEPTQRGANSTVTPPFLSVVSWILYDLANTIFAMGILSLYLPLWVVDVMGGTDGNYAVAVSVSIGIIFICSPLLGALTDQAPRRLPFLIVSTLLCVGCMTLFGSGGLLGTLILFGIANIAHSAGQQFYDALLPVVTTPQNRGKIGGIGIGVGYIGSLIAIGLGFVILGETADLPQAVVIERYQLLFFALSAAFLLFALPCFLFVREQPRIERRFTLASVGAAARQVGETFRSMDQFPGLRRFLIGRVFYIDAVNTVILFMGIYLTQEIGLSEREVLPILFVSILASIAGGLGWSQVVDRWGPKYTLNVVLLLWMSIFLLAAAMGFLGLPAVLVWPLAIGAGIALAGTATADRPYMLQLTPPERVGEFYGLYGMVGRFAAIVGPLLWGFIVDTLGLGRPTAILVLLLSVVIGYLILRGVSDGPHRVA